MERLYTSKHLSAQEISRLAGDSRSGVLKALDRFNILRNENENMYLFSRIEEKQRAKVRWVH